ncbi:hypothetical protein DFH08DRAFT_834364 [Mycena albidolilacea]|uniref:Uncharacterized protein n=1 Tax=Mycena albidolilacea TaxID=1033008 RepID=A0AAD7ARI1_9AGAR|nr:hypothetical protein DFH08DRAFT_834364 [Mycena albidolilacea]
MPPGPSWDWIHAACRASPCLTHLATSQFSLDWFPASNLRQLTCLELLDVPMPMSTAFHLLEQVTLLESFSIKVEGPAVARSTGGVLVTKSVSTVEITCHWHLGQFLEQLEFPCLENISIRQVLVWPETEFHSFLSRSACALKTLELYNVHAPEERIIACLQHKACHTLESLVCNPYTADAILQHLTYREGWFPNPKLRAIDIGDIHTTDGRLSVMVESRLFLPTIADGVLVPERLQKVRFSFQDGLSVSQSITHTKDWTGLWEAKMKALELGLKVEIAYNRHS